MTQLQARHGELLQTVDPTVLGARIRAARIVRGWTQTSLAGNDLSVGYVSRIENGDRRPTLRVLTTIADRLGTSLDDLLQGVTTVDYDEIRLGLSYAELALQNGEALDAEHQARTHLERAEGAGLEDLVEQGRFVVARAMEALGQLDEAITEYEKLLENTTGLTAIRCGIALSRTYRLVGDLALAVDVGERLRPTLVRDGLDRTDEAVQLAMTVALAYIQRGDLSRAARICQQAVQTAEEIASPTARSAAYWNSSIVYSERGETQAAIALARRALALLGEGQDSRNLARLRLELGRLQLNVEPADVADAITQVLRGQEELRATSASDEEVAHGDTILAQAFIRDGQPDRAVELAEAARMVVPEDAPLSRAEAIAVHGEALAQAGRTEEAHQAYLEAMEALEQVEGADRFAAQVWFDLASLLEDLGDSEAATAALRGAAVASGLRPRVHVAARDEVRAERASSAQRDRVDS